MLNIKNNFLWKILGTSRFQNKIEKFDKEFREKSRQAINRKKTIKHKSKLLEANKGANI